MPEDKKRSGCGCGGCMLFSFYSVIILLAGMFLSNLVDNDWNFNSSKDKLIKDSTTIVFLVKDLATKIITGEEPAKPAQPDKSPVSAAPLTSATALVRAADESYGRAMELLKNARKATGAERQKLLHDLQSELQNSLSKYQEAEAKDNGNPELLKKISHISDLLDKMKP